MKMKRITCLLIVAVLVIVGNVGYAVDNGINTEAVLGMSEVLDTPQTVEEITNTDDITNSNTEAMSLIKEVVVSHIEITGLPKPEIGKTKQDLWRNYSISFFDSNGSLIRNPTNGNNTLPHVWAYDFFENENIKMTDENTFKAGNSYKFSVSISCVGEIHTSTSSFYYILDDNPTVTIDQKNISFTRNGSYVSFEIDYGVLICDNHNYGTDWKSDENNHWHECICGDKSDEGAHTFEWVADHEECTICGYKKAPTVTFKDWNGTIIKSEVVNYGEAATAPPNPTRNGYIFTGWDTVFDNIASDLTVTAQYAKMPIQDVDILDEAKALDPSNAEDMEKLKELESIYKDRENVTVNITAEPNTHGDFKQNIDAISIVGAAFNAKQNETITLHFSKPANNVVIDGTRYKTNNAVQFDIRLINCATPLQNLDVPVTITVPIPSGVKESNFWILHYHNNGDYEVITPKLNGDGTCTFTVVNFSVFAFVNGVEVSENGGTATVGSASNGTGTATVSADLKSTSNAPKTGDETNIINWILVAAMSAIAITVILILHRKYTGDMR